MCRFLLYAGREVVLADLVVRPKHSLINQSIHSHEREEPLNGDGFGVGWYDPRLSRDPCVFTSVTPAWSNRNLMRIADGILSPLIFAHVRAATPGLTVSELNCHPFSYKHLMWMHNGFVNSFDQVRRCIREKLPDPLYNMVQGTTDSEHAFALFLSHLPDNFVYKGPEPLKEAMLKTIVQLNEATENASIAAPSHYNFAVTDGDSIVVTRYTNREDDEPESLYYLVGERFRCEDELCEVIPTDGKAQAIVVASERLTSEGWKSVPRNHMITIDSSLKISITSIDV